MAGPKTCWFLEEILRCADHNLAMAQSGDEALKRILESDFAAVLLDVQMPGIDGFETATLIRQRRQTASTPIIFITAASQTSETTARAYSLGAVDFLFKPIVPNILKAKVKAFVNLFAMRQEIELNARRIEAINHQLEQEITERNLVQAEVLKLNRSLEEKIQELDLSNKELEAFSYSVSHDLSMLIQCIFGTFQDASPNRKVELITAPNVTILADMNLIRLAMENLVGNAWKYTSKKTSAKIEFGVDSHETERTKGKIICFIKDNGAGFDMSLVNRLFTPFQRLHPESEFSGTGIGLAIVQRIIRWHGGLVWAEAEAGQGATFYFTLPGT